MDFSSSFLNVAGISALIFIAVVVIVGGFIISVVSKVKDTAETISQVAYGTRDIAKGIEKQRFEYATTPKTVASATRLYLPQIEADFPDFSYEEAKVRAENVLTSYLRAIDQDDPDILTDAGDDLKEELRTRINMLRDVRQSEQYDKIKVHNTAIAQYRKTEGRCSVVFQTSVQYIHYLMDSAGNVLKGTKDMMEQGRYNVTMAYVQDATQSPNERDYVLSLTCPNCGAPITNLGQKTCEYCGSGIVEANRKVWNFQEIKPA